MTLRHLLLLISAVVSLAQAAPVLQPDAATKCSSCDEWNQPRDPFRIFGNTYYVGTHGLTAVLVTSNEGHILLDAALPQSAAFIDANIRKLGFRTDDIRLIVNSHEHFDHAGGLAAMQRASGAEVAASVVGARALQQGYPTPEDPQYESGRGALRFRPVARVKVVGDGETLRVGALAITAHYTPGHTPGATSWSWRSCEGTRCLDIVYVDSLSAVSDDGYRFTAHPDVVESYRRSFTRVEQLPCDVLLAPHPAAFGLDDKLTRRAKDPSVNAFIEPGACRSYAAAARQRLDARLAAEKAGPPQR